MDLIERYLAAIRVLLPSAQRDDITAELRDVLLSRREEKAEELGRPLTRGEDEDLVRDFGHPVTVAARYGRQQYLVGPELFSIYVFVLKIVLPLVAVGAVINAVVVGVALQHPLGAAIASSLGVFWNGALVSVGVITILFALLQRYEVRLLRRWNPRDLPRPTRRRRGETVFDHVGVIVWQGVLILWWVHALDAWFPELNHLPVARGEVLGLIRAPIWETLFWPVLALPAAVILVRALRLAGAAAGRFADALSLVVQIAFIAVASLALRAGHWIDVSGTGLPAANLAKAAVGINIGVQVTLIVVILMALASAAWTLWRLARGGEDTASAHAPTVST